METLLCEREMIGPVPEDLTPFVHRADARLKGMAPRILSGRAEGGDPGSNRMPEVLVAMDAAMEGV